jgi:N-acetylmuramoyl-L-alanine amidase
MGSLVSLLSVPEHPSAFPELGQPRYLFVIDPGHGGSNTGAPGLGGHVYEKEITLALALALKDRLLQLGVDVVLTRDKDEYLSLRERTRIANELGADLFISLHTNASQDRTRQGFETYILSPEALDVEGPALRAGDGRLRPGVDADIAALLDDIECGAVHARSAAIAASVQREIAAVRGADRDRGVKQASMHVLLGATMPAVLIEVGFLNHPVEGRDLQDPVIRGRIADAIATAVVRSSPISSAQQLRNALVAHQNELLVGSTH